MESAGVSRDEGPVPGSQKRFVARNDSMGIANNKRGVYLSIYVAMGDGHLSDWIETSKINICRDCHVDKSARLLRHRYVKGLR